MILETALKNYENAMRKKGSSEKTIKKYYNQIKKAFVFSNKTGENRNTITLKEIEKYIKSNKKRTHNTKCTEIAQIKSFFSFCNIEKICDLDSRRILRPKKEIIEAKYLKENEISKILKKIEKYDIKVKTSILFLLHTGTRISEACSITKKQLKKAILIKKNYQITVKGKNKRIRSIFIPEKIYQLCLKNAILHEQKNIFWINQQQLQREIRKIRNEIKINFTAHTFRHTYITQLAKKGASIYKIQKLAWHSNINTTASYLHAERDELSETAELANFGI